MTIDDDLRFLAERQHGLVARWQANQMGASRAALRRRLDGPAWEVVTPRVLRLVGSVRTPGQRAMSAVLDGGLDARLSHTSGAAWWGIAGFGLRTLHDTRPRGRTRQPSSLAVIHEVLDIAPHHCTVLDGIPILRPGVIIFQLCGMVNPMRAERALDNGWSMGLYDGAQLLRTHDELRDRGRAGTVLLRRLLKARGRDYVPPASGLEGRVTWILERAGERRLRRQVNSGGETWTGRVDLRDEELPFILEVQSERYHSALLDVEADEARIKQLEGDGFVVAQVTDAQAWQHPAEIVDAVRRGRAKARLRRAA
jgi:hypothetical protein